MRDDIDISKLKAKLLVEYARLEQQLDEIGKLDDLKPNDWNPIKWDENNNDQDPIEVADEIEDYVMNTAASDTLEVRFREVLAALERIKEGTYGYDEETGEPIKAERLQANPAATQNV